MSLEPVDLRLGEIDRIHIDETIRLHQNRSTHHHLTMTGGGDRNRFARKVFERYLKKILARPAESNSRSIALEGYPLEETHLPRPSFT